MHVVCLKIRADADTAFLRKLWDEIGALRTIDGVLGLDIGPASLALYSGYVDRTAGSGPAIASDSTRLHALPCSAG